MLQLTSHSALGVPHTRWLETRSLSCYRVTPLTCLSAAWGTTIWQQDFAISFKKCYMVGNFREGFTLRFSRVKSHAFAKLKPRKFCCPRAKRTNRISILSPLEIIYTPANRRVSASVLLTAIAEVIQEIEMLRSTNVRTRERKAESGSNRYYERPGYEATFLAALKELKLPSFYCKRF